MDAVWWWVLGPLVLTLVAWIVAEVALVRWVLRQPDDAHLCDLQAPDDRCPHCSPPVTATDVARRKQEIDEYFERGGVQ